MPAIAATEAQYAEMWAQDAVAMYGYAALSVAASELNPFLQPPTTASPDATAGQAAAVGEAVGSAAAAVAPTAAIAPLLSALGTSISASAPVAGVEAILAQLGFSLDPASIALPPWFVGPNGLLATIFGNSTNIWNSVTNYPYFSLGSVNSLVAWGGGLLPGAPAPNPALGGALTPPGAIGAWGNPVSAGWGQASTIGKMSVPPTWTATTVSQITPLSPANSTFSVADAGSHHGAGANGLLRGIPTNGVGRRGAEGYVTKYGFRYNVLTRSPSAG